VHSDVALFAAVREGEGQDLLVPRLRRPLVGRVRESAVGRSDGEGDGLAVGLVGDDEGVDEGGEGEQGGEEGEDGPRQEDARGAVLGILRAVSPVGDGA
jgi:hypothetical protein